MLFYWKEEYEDLAKEFLLKHFGGSSGLTATFPCMRGNYPWHTKRPPVLDSRVPAKNNTEYHGLEQHASQYHATNQYEYAYHHWLMSAYWRLEDMKTNDFGDLSHQEAIRYALRHAFYNRALAAWQKAVGDVLPQPEDFDLHTSDIDKKSEIALKELKEFRENFDMT